MIRFLIAGLVIGLWITAPVQAATFTVNRTGANWGTDTHDTAPGDGVCVDSAGWCSLRAAIEETNALPSVDTINLGSAVHTAETGPLIIASGANLTINGASPTGTIVQGELQAVYAFHSVFQVSANATLSLNLMTIRHGLDPAGGAIKILGGNTVSLWNCIVTSNRAARYSGPAGDVRGGGIYSLNSSLTLTSTTVRSNYGVAPSGYNASGAGVYVEGGSLAASYSLIQGNEIYGGTSGTPANNGVGLTLSRVASGSIANTDILANVNTSPRSVRGVGIYITGNGTTSNINISNSNIKDNTASGGSNNRGGGIAIEGSVSGTVSVDSSTIHGNRVSDSAGFGGGLYMEAFAASPMSLRITNSTISANTAGHSGGGMMLTNNGSAATTGRSTITLENDTISGNFASQNGGGIYFVKWNGAANPFQMDSRYATITNNHANLDGMGTEGGGGIFASGDKVNLMSSIVYNNIVYGPSFGHDLRGNFYLQDYNHFGHLPGASFFNFNATNTVGSASIGPLQNNGGPTLTHLSFDYNTVVDKIPPGTNGCGTTYQRDQRNYYRPWIWCDKGAVEWTHPL